MLIPVRCFTCGRLIADKYEEYQDRVGKEEDPEIVLDNIGIERYCCRRMFLTTVETIRQVIPFYESIQRRKQEVQAELE